MSPTLVLLADAGYPSSEGDVLIERQVQTLRRPHPRWVELAGPFFQPKDRVLRAYAYDDQVRVQSEPLPRRNPNRYSYIHVQLPERKP